MATVDKEAINDWAYQSYQCLFFGDTLKDLKQPVSKEIIVNASAFFLLHLSCFL